MRLLQDLRFAVRALRKAAAFAALAILTERLFGVSPLDPLSFAAAGAILASAVIAASAVPAERAARVEPMTALRSE